MRSFLSVRRAWSVRLLGSALFAVGAAALAHAAGGSGATAVDRGGKSQLGSAYTFTPSIPRRPADSTVRLGRSGVFNGTTIVVSAGPWTPEAIYQMLEDNGLGSMGTHLTVRVEDAFPPTRITMSNEFDRVSGRPVRWFTLWLDAWPDSQFSRRPDATIAHQVGRLWIAQVFDGKGGFWSDYLRMRGLQADPRLHTSALLDPQEIHADDYRLLFGSGTAIDQQPEHMNLALSDPRRIGGLRDFLAGSLPAR